jgi:ankyrin repeat protein
MWSLAARGDTELLDVLLEGNYSLQITTATLQATSEGGHLEVVERLLTAGANVNADPARYDGRTALQAACEGGHLEIVERLQEISNLRCSRCASVAVF